MSIVSVMGKTFIIILSCDMNIHISHSFLLVPPFRLCSHFQDRKEQFQTTFDQVEEKASLTLWHWKNLNQHENFAKTVSLKALLNKNNQDSHQGTPNPENSDVTDQPIILLPGAVTRESLSFRSINRWQTTWKSCVQPAFDIWDKMEQREEEVGLERITEPNAMLWCNHGRNSRFISAIVSSVDMGGNVCKTVLPQGLLSVVLCTQKAQSQPRKPPQGYPD